MLLIIHDIFLVVSNIGKTIQQCCYIKNGCPAQTGSYGGYVSNSLLTGLRTIHHHPLLLGNDAPSSCYNGNPPGFPIEGANVSPKFCLFSRGYHVVSCVFPTRRRPMKRVHKTVQHPPTHPSTHQPRPTWASFNTHPFPGFFNDFGSTNRPKHACLDLSVFLRYDLIRCDMMWYFMI